MKGPWTHPVELTTYYEAALSRSLEGDPIVSVSLSHSPSEIF